MVEEETAEGGFLFDYLDEEKGTIDAKKVNATLKLMKKTAPASEEYKNLHRYAVLVDKVKEFNKLVKELTDDGNKAVNDFVMPYVPSDYMSAGSTDVGDVSWLTPTAQFSAATWASNCPGHSWQMVATGKTSFAHKAMLYAGMVLAGTAVDLMTNPAILKDARAEFAVTAAEGYDCPLDNKVVAGPQ